MARIPYVTRTELPEDIAEMFNKMEASGAHVLNLWKMSAHSPTTLKHMVRMGNAVLSKMSLDPRLREMAILRVAETLDCEYERRAHTMWARDIGISEEKIQSIKDWEQSKAFSDMERAALRFTDEITGGGRVSEATFREAAKHLDLQQLAELSITAGYYGLLARSILLPFEVDLEEKLASPSQIIGGQR